MIPHNSEVCSIHAVFAGAPTILSKYSHHAATAPQPSSGVLLLRAIFQLTVTAKDVVSKDNVRCVIRHPCCWLHPLHSECTPSPEKVLGAWDRSGHSRIAVAFYNT